MSLISWNLLPIPESGVETSDQKLKSYLTEQMTLSPVLVLALKNLPSQATQRPGRTHFSDCTAQCSVSEEPKSNHGSGLPHCPGLSLNIYQPDLFNNYAIGF